MATVSTVVRGNVVRFEVVFKNSSGVAVDPDDANVLISYLNESNVRTLITVEMAWDSSGSWTAEWDTSVASPGMVFWSARSTNPSSAKDDRFEVKANPANLGM